MPQQEPYIDYSKKPDEFPHPAADAWGEDEFGWWISIAINGVDQVFRWIFPGKFQMGSPEDEPERVSREAQHWVILTHGIWLSDTTCTQALWQAVVGGENPSHFQEDTLNPVEQVSWDDIHEKFIPAIEAKANLTVRLPSEAEWEYACRAETTTPFYFGENITSEQVNYDGNSPYNEGKKGEYRGKTVAVKSMDSPNLWGLHEMHGNVREWCEDQYGEYQKGEQVDPVGSESGTNRVWRGGSWFNDGEIVRSAYRYICSPDFRGYDIGFRFALGQPELKQEKQAS